MKVRVIMGLLVCSMMLSACSGVVRNILSAEKTARQTETQVKETEEKTETANTQEQQETAKSPDIETQAEENADEKEVEANKEENDKKVSDSEEYIRGSYTESGYESSYLGIRYEAPEGTLMTTEEELNTLAGMSMDMLSDDLTEIQKKYTEAAVIYEMMTMSPSGTPNMIICLEKLLVKSITTEQYIELAAGKFDGLTAFNVNVVNTGGTVDIAGQQYHTMETIVDDGTNFMNQDYYVRKVGNRMMLMTITYTEDTKDLADEMLSSVMPF